MGDWEEGLFIFRELGSTGKLFYFKRFREHCQKAEEKTNLGLRGDQSIIFSDQGSIEPHVEMYEPVHKFLILMAYMQKTSLLTYPVGLEV